jgi:hypothetical protein
MFFVRKIGCFKDLPKPVFTNLADEFVGTDAAVHHKISSAPAARCAGDATVRRTL